MDDYKMHTLQRKTDGTAIKTIKQMILAMGLLLTVLPVFAIWGSDSTVTPVIATMLLNMFIAGISILMAVAIIAILFSRYSPIELLAIRKNIMLFDKRFLKSISEDAFIYSAKWKYAIKNNKIIIDLYPNGLVHDTADIGKRLAQNLYKILLKYEESDYKIRYIFGSYPDRYNGIALLGKGITDITGEYKPMRSYKPIPIYDNVTWDFTSEALHILMIAPSGAGKTMFLNYLCGMVLKRQHMLYVIDAKNSPFGALYKHIGVPVATNIKEILDMLKVLVSEMENIYSEHFSNNLTDIGANYSTLKLKGHFLIFDEILSVLSSATKKEKEEIEKLLGQLALKGRAAGFSIVITAQKLNATDLSKAITEQCQTRIVLGKMVSDETFHQATQLYKKDAVTVYKGGVGAGYAITPKTEGLAYIKTPRMPINSRKYITLMKELRDRGTPYGQGN